nr:CIA30 family protein [uncultured Tateyamaria sp.]
MADDFELTPEWEYVADTVMGGVSRGQAREVALAGRAATRLTGTVSLDNNGGFVQIAFDLAGGEPFDASGYTGIALDVFGNGAEYDLRLRTDALTRPWQSFRTTFTAPAVWTTIDLPFTAFKPHRTEAVFDPAGLRRIGILAIGREMDADVAVAAVRLIR